MKLNSNMYATLTVKGPHKLKLREDDSNSTYCEKCGCRITQGRCQHGITPPNKLNNLTPTTPNFENSVESFLCRD